MFGTRPHTLSTHRFIDSYQVWTNIIKNVFTQSLLGYDTRSIFERSKIGLNPEFFFSKAKEPYLLFYLFKARWRIDGAMPWLRFELWLLIQFLMSKTMTLSAQYSNVSIYPTPPSRAGCDTRLVFKRSKTSLNSEFSFAKSGCLNKAKVPSLLYYLSIENIGIGHVVSCLSQGHQCEVKGKKNPLPGFELGWTDYLLHSDNRFADVRVDDQTMNKIFRVILGPSIIYLGHVLLWFNLQLYHPL